MRPEQPIYKDLSGSKKAQIKEFVFNPKPADPAVADRITDELYINQADNQLKFYDADLDLRYLVPGIVKSTAPTVLDVEYPLGTEWALDNGSETYKLIEIDNQDEARWLPMHSLEPLKLVTANMQFYVDDVAGSNTNDGSAALPFKTIVAAIAIINRTYDFNNGLYNYTLNIVSATQASGFIRLNRPVGAITQTFNIVGVNPETEIVLTQAHLFICPHDVAFKLNNLKIVGSTGKQTAINCSEGSLTVQNCTITGSFLRAFTVANEGRVFSTNNVIDSVSGSSLVFSTYRSEFYHSGTLTIKGTNTFTYCLNLHDYSSNVFVASSSIVLDTGATITGHKFVKQNNSMLRFWGIDFLRNLGDAPGIWNGGGIYRDRPINHNYSHWVEGLQVSLLDGNILELTEGEVVIILQQHDKASQSHRVNVFSHQVVFFPSVLETHNEAWIFIENNETIVFKIVPPDPDNLISAVCIGKVTTVDNINFASVESFIKERSPEFLDSLNSPGAIPSCVVANQAINTLNDTIAGTVLPLDPATFSTSSPNFTLTGNTITVSDPGIYRIDADINCSVPNTSVNHISVGSKITINGSQRLKAGRSGYLRGIDNHLKASSSVSARVSLNANDIIGVVGFRDATGGTVDTPAGESELTIMKLT